MNGTSYGDMTDADTGEFAEEDGVGDGAKCLKFFQIKGVSF